MEKRHLLLEAVLNGERYMKPLSQRMRHWFHKALHLLTESLKLGLTAIGTRLRTFLPGKEMFNSLVLWLNFITEEYVFFLF